MFPIGMADLGTIMAGMLVFPEVVLLAFLLLGMWFGMCFITHR
jgi:hypothetical protein